MAIDLVLFDQLCALSARFRPEGRTLMLGRQRFEIEERMSGRYDAVLMANGLAAGHADYLQDDGYCETMMRKLAFGEMEAMDFSDFEGAGILHDLNRPVPADLVGQFDLIFDGGTIEHVFNVPQALENVFTMLRPGGRFVSANGMNGWVGHGLYQFGPDLVWSFWARTAGCAVHRCLGLGKGAIRLGRAVSFSDPAKTGLRLRLRGKLPPGRVYLYYEVERLAQSALRNTTLQSDYETKWSSHNSAGETRINLQ